jgi:hypothetical protein
MTREGKERIPILLLQVMVVSVPDTNGTSISSSLKTSSCVLFIRPLAGPFPYQPLHG